VSAGGSTSYGVTITPTSGSPSVTLSASGLPAGTNAAFSPNPTTSSSTMTVTTSSSTPAGTYQLAITGTAGSTAHSTSVSLTVDPATAGAVPGAPTNLVAAPASGKGVSLSWSAPASNGGSAITNYRIYRGPSATGLALRTTVGNVTSYKDTSTTRGTTYWYAVSAVNPVGEGPQSNSVSVRAK
jgi:fibronectin type 3 domain-containing protein